MLFFKLQLGFFTEIKSHSRNKIRNNEEDNNNHITRETLIFLGKITPGKTPMWENQLFSLWILLCSSRYGKFLQSKSIYISG
jgi:hypothetical protein